MTVDELVLRRELHASQQRVCELEHALREATARADLASASARAAWAFSKAIMPRPIPVEPIFQASRELPKKSRRLVRPRHASRRDLPL